MPKTHAYWLGSRDYLEVWAAMRAFTDQRKEDTANHIWLLEHPPVYTQGQAGKAEHILAPGDIPVVASDRGGQVTYHGPGQLVVYPLVNLKHLQSGRGAGIRSLVSALEQAMIACLDQYGIPARGDRDAPGVYVENRKIGSIGLRVRRQCCYHGISLNVDMDLEPFTRINPCGYQGLEMTQIAQLGGPGDAHKVAADLLPHLEAQLGLEIDALQSWRTEALPTVTAAAA